MANRTPRLVAALGAVALLLGVANFSLGLSALLVPGGLKARFKLDEGSGTSAADSSGTGNTGTLTNGPTWTAGKVGQALSFDGTDDYVSCGVTGMAAANAAQSVSYWMNYATTPSGNQNCVALSNASGNSAVQCGFRGGKVTAWKSGGGVLAEASAPAAGLWHHVAYTFDGTTHRLYLNGTQVNTSTTAPQTDTPTALNLGRWVGGSEYYAGKLDEVKVYSRTLTAAEVAGLAHDPALETLVRFDEGSGTTASDSSGIGHDGTLSGPTWVAGQTGQALSFDGTDDYVTMSLETGLPANNAAQTVAYWMNVASNPSGTQCAIDLHNDGSGSALQLGFRNGNVTAWNHGGNVLAQATPPSAGAWHHVAYTYDGTTHTLSLDGVSAGTSTASPQTAAVTSLVLGRWNGGPGEYFGGKLDELRIYSRALSADEIAGIAGGSGTGLAAVYYDNMDWTGTFIQRTDSQVNFNWGTGSPDAAIGADTFSAVWTGQVQPQWSETYTFYTNTDDGVRLWVNGQIVVDFPQDQSPTERSGQITLSGGVKYNLRMEYFENGGGAVAELRWSSSSTPKALVPQSQLYPTDTTAPQILAATSNSTDLTKVYVRFTEAMAKSTVETTGNWTLSGGLTVSSVALSSDKKVATITASGSVTLGTTQVTASSSILGITREALASPFTFTIVDGNSQGIPGSTAITLIMTTDGNHSAVMFNEPSSHGVSQGVGEIFRIEAPGATATTVTLRQSKKIGGQGAIDFLTAGDVPTTTVTTSGGAPNVAFAVCRHKATSAFGGDILVEALVSGEVRGTKDVTAVQLDITPKYSHVSDQGGVNAVAQITPHLQNLELTNTTFLLDFGKTDGTTPTTLLKMPAWSLTNASGQATRYLNSIGVESFYYDVVQLKRPQVALFNTEEGAKCCQKKTIPDPKYCPGGPESVQAKGDSMYCCPNADPRDTGTSGGTTSMCAGRSIDCRETLGVRHGSGIV
jgi:hypothetical protein